MRKFLISAAIAASSLALAAPAAAQWAPAPRAYGYSNGYGNNGYNYGYNNNFGQVRSLQARIDQVQRQIVNLGRRNILSNREANSLMGDSYKAERRLRDYARDGVSWRESRDIQQRVARLEQRVFREARDGNQWRGGNGQFGYNDGRYIDRDRDGRNDRYEDDHGYRRD